MQDGRSDVVIPLVEETARLDKVVRETGRVRVTTGVSERSSASKPTSSTKTSSHPHRARRTRGLHAAHPHRGDVTIYPVVEEVLVVERRLVLREEVHVTRRRRSNTSGRTSPSAGRKPGSSGPTSEG
jgi:stress response protein YsnF